MKKPNSGWSFHCHHEILIEWCSDYKERVKYIKEQKPEHERALRLKLFRLIPPKQMEKIFGQKTYVEWQKTYAEWQKAYAEWQKADAEWQKAYAEWQKADAEWQKADAERQKAYAEWQKAYAEWQKALEKNLPAILALHKKLCGCNWGNKLTGNIFAGAE